MKGSIPSERWVVKWGDGVGNVGQSGLRTRSSPTWEELMAQAYPELLGGFPVPLRFLVTKTWVND